MEKHKRITTKAVSILLILLVGSTLFTANVFANQKGRVGIVAFVQEMYDAELTVHLIPIEGGETKTYKLNKENEWGIVDDVLVGKYRIESELEGKSKRNILKTAYSPRQQSVKANNENDFPIFSAMEGDADFINGFTCLLSDESNKTTPLRGRVTKEECIAYLNESVSMQDADFMKGGKYEQEGGAWDSLKHEWKTNKEKNANEKKDIEKFTPETNSHSEKTRNIKSTVQTIALIVTFLIIIATGVIGIYLFVKKKTH